MESLPQLHRVQVAAGSGSLVFSGAGRSIRIGVRPPSEAAIYNAEITDVDGFIVASRTQQTGSFFIALAHQFHGEHTAAITTATVNGEYKVKIWHE